MHNMKVLVFQQEEFEPTASFQHREILENANIFYVSENKTGDQNIHCKHNWPWSDQ